MQAFLIIKMLGTLSAVVGPMPDWNNCVTYLPDFEKRADAVFQKPEYLQNLRQKYPNIQRTDIVHECIESNTRPEVQQ